MSNSKQEKNQNFLKKLLYFEISFFTGSMVLITAFVIAASAMPGPAKTQEESALEAILTTFVNDDEIIRADIETQKLRLKIYRNNYYEKLEETKNKASEDISLIVEVE